MATLFAAEIGTMLWILIATNLLRYGLSLRSLVSQVLISAAGTFAEHVSITGYYYNHIDMCFGNSIPAYGYVWAPCLAFDVILAVLAVWAGSKHSRRQSYSLLPGFNGSRLVDVVIQGNVIYFLGWAF